MLFKLSNLNSNLALTLGYLNPALNNSAPLACVAGGISVGALYCLGDRAARRVGTGQIEFLPATILGYFE